MAHKVLVNGTSYEVKKGRTLVGGTGYDIKKGRTLVGGTGYDIKFSAALKWYLNNTVEIPTKELRANFTTTNIIGGTLNFVAINSWYDPNAAAEVLSYTESNNGDEVDYTAYNPKGKTWTSETYRTITFEEPPTGDLLTWLEANGTPQE